MNNYGIEELIRRINMENPQAHARELCGAIIISNDVDPFKLKYPRGYYYNEKNGVTNKYKTPNGSYVSYVAMAEKEVA